MIIAIDIGGTKTLVTLCSLDNTIIERKRFDTPKNYVVFLNNINICLASLNLQNAQITVVAVPGKLDRKHGIGIIFGNLPWQNVPIAEDIAKLTKTAVIIENDANLAGLSETHRLRPMPKKSLYLTISTGIGTGITTNGYINPALADAEGGTMLMIHNGKLLKWESYASGRAIAQIFHKTASEINDINIWKIISKDLAIGIINLCAIIQPDAIIIGGGVGTHLNKFKTFLETEINQIRPPAVSVPSITKAQFPEDAVIYGCVQLAKQYEQHH